MIPEVKTINPAHITAQQTRFNGAVQRFGRLYADGQNQFAPVTNLFRTIGARISGRPTPAQEMAVAIEDLRETRLDLTEARARQAAQGIRNDAAYRQQLATTFAQEYITGTAQETVVATQIENSNLGAIDDVYRANTSIYGSLTRALGGGLLIYAASGVANWIQGPNAITATEVGVFVAATGAIDTARQFWLAALSRSQANPGIASIGSLIRRRASIHEGRITGDELDGSIAIDQELEHRLTQDTLAQLQLDGTTRPDIFNPGMDDVIAQRTSLRSKLPRYQDLTELVRARDIAKTSRLIRLGLTGILLAGLVYAHTTRPEYCGTRTFPQQDELMKEATGGAIDISSARGMAKGYLFEDMFGHKFNPKNRGDQTLLEKTTKYDPFTYKKLYETIVTKIKGKNPQITFIGDFIKQGEVYEVCPAERAEVYRTIPLPVLPSTR